MKRVFEVEWDDELGPFWMNKDSLLVCLNTKLYCGEGLIQNIEDVTEGQWLLNMIKKKILKKMRSVRS
jgi:hypothetical protein